MKETKQASGQPEARDVVREMMAMRCWQVRHLPLTIHP